MGISSSASRALSTDVYRWRFKAQPIIMSARALSDSHVTTKYPARYNLHPHKFPSHPYYAEITRLLNEVPDTCRRKDDRSTCRPPIKLSFKTTIKPILDRKLPKHFHICCDGGHFPHYRMVTWCFSVWTGTGIPIMTRTGLRMGDTFVDGEAEAVLQALYFVGMVTGFRPEAKFVLVSDCKRLIEAIDDRKLLRLIRNAKPEKVIRTRETLLLLESELVKHRNVQFLHVERKENFISDFFGYAVVGIGSGFTLYYGGSTPLNVMDSVWETSMGVY